MQDVFYHIVENNNVVPVLREYIADLPPERKYYESFGDTSDVSYRFQIEIRDNPILHFKKFDEISYGRHLPIREFGSVCYCDYGLSTYKILNPEIVKKSFDVFYYGVGFFSPFGYEKIFLDPYFGDLLEIRAECKVSSVSEVTCDEFEFTDFPVQDVKQYVYHQIVYFSIFYNSRFSRFEKIYI